MRVLADRFELRAPLGAGGMGQVFRAFDRVRGEEVALKLLPELDATALARFKQEFRALHDVRHPHLVELYELHEDAGTWFFTMQRVDGVDVVSWIDGDVGRLRQVLPQIAAALHHLHAAGLVHRDIKPSNILVGADARAVVLDFGLVAPTWSAGEGVGTPAFMAPEQADAHIAPAADWYAFGVLVFRVLTGRLPFIGNAEQIVAAKLGGAAPGVRSIAARAPLDLAELADSLLARDAGRRPNGEAVLAVLGGDAGTTQFAGQIVVGRERELAELRDAMLARMAGVDVAVAVTGESGIGKTTLLRAFAEDAEGQAWVLQGRCWERESVPYKGIDGIVDELVARLEADERELELGDGEWMTLLAQAFPVVRRLSAFAQLPASAAGARGERTARVSGAVRALLARVAATQAVVVIVDDLQWADRDALLVLHALLDPVPPGVHVIVGAREPIVLAARTPIQTIALAPLSEGETRELVTLVAREIGAALDVAAITREVAGHPLFAAELARHAAATGAHQPVGFDDSVMQQADRLGPAAVALANVVCVAYAPLSIAVAARATREAAPQVFAALPALRSARLIASTGSGAAMQIEPYHDRIRRVLRGRVEAGALRAIHEQLASAFEEGRADPQTIALHWAEAGNPANAATYAVRAAEHAEATLAFHGAARLYLWAAELAPARRDLRIKAAQCLALAGRGVEAADLYLACARELEGISAIDARRRAMHELMLLGHSERGLAIADELMAEMSLPNPSGARLLAGFVMRRAKIRLRGSARGTTPLSPLDRARTDLLWDVSAGMLMVDPLGSLYHHSLNLDLCAHHSDDNRFARALIGEVPYLAAGGRRTRPLMAALARADEAGRRLATPILGDVVHGLAAFFMGDWQAAHDRLVAAEHSLSQGPPPLVADSLGPTHLIPRMGSPLRLPVACLYYLGRLSDLARRLPDLVRDADERHDVGASTYFRAGVQCVTYLAFDDVDTAVRNVEVGARPWQATRGRVPHFMELHARTAIDLYMRRDADAYRRVLERWHDFEESRLVRGQYTRVSLCDIRGRAALAAATSSAEQRRTALADAARLATRLRREGAPWSVALGHSLAAGVALARDEIPQAASALAHAEQCFTTAAMPIYAANAVLVRAQVLGDTTAARAATSVLAGAGVVDIERFSQVLLPRAG